MISVENKSTIYQKLLNIQVELKAPKSQYNKFGNYNYRNCEDILEALKILLNKNKVTVIISDMPVSIGNRIYIQATVKFIDIESGEIIETTAQAREEETKKGMDASQITGSASSYARKYALNGMFAIDDTKDADNGTIKDDKTDEDKIKAKVTDIDTEVLTKVKKILWYASDKNKEKSLKLLEEYTKFTGKDGKEVPGITEFEKLSNGRLKATYGKLQKQFPELHKRVKEETRLKKEAV